MNCSVDKGIPAVDGVGQDAGGIEIGYDDAHRSFIRALDSVGMVWEGRMVYATLESALQALDDALAAWMKENVEQK
jgi:hypothetical protein